MAAAQASAALFAPQRASVSAVAVELEPQALRHRRSIRPAPRPPATGPDLEAIYYDLETDKKGRRGTFAHQFLPVDGLRKPVSLMIGDGMAAQLEFGGAYRLKLDVGHLQDYPLVIQTPEYIGSRQAVKPFKVLFDIQARSLVVSLCGHGYQKLDFARGAEAAAVLTSAGFPQADWQCVKGKSPWREMVGMPEELEIHSVVKAQRGSFHAVGLPVLHQQGLMAPVVRN